MNTVSFPGLGIGEFTINEIAFKIPFLKDYRGVAWYGIIITLAIIVSFLYVMTHSKREGIKSDDVVDLAIFLIPSAIIGARLYYVIFYGGYDNFYDIIAFWNGGLAIYGGIIGGSLAIIGVTLFKKIHPLKMFDTIAPALMLGQAIGRWGNFVNAEAYGAETDLPWRMGIHNGAIATYVHPTFFYESLWNIIGFVIISLIYRKKKFDGQILCTYIAWYGFGRMIIEGLRTDSLYFGSIRISQLVGFISFVVGSVLLIVLGFRARKKRLIAESYDLQYSDEEKIICGAYKEGSSSVDVVTVKVNADSTPDTVKEKEQEKEEENGKDN